MSTDALAALRRDYRGTPLLEENSSPDPFAQFKEWFDAATAAQVLEPNAMTLATVDPHGWPSTRIVLLKGFSTSGFVFFTNYGSQKARELRENARASLCFWWAELERQVRVQGEVTQVPRSVSAEYFASRPRGSQIGAWASNQSAELHSRDELRASVARIEARYEGEEIPVPDDWGGFSLAPRRFEFWQGQSSRLHDRLEYRDDGKVWLKRRLSP